jgi:signal transduction histidine kinase
VAKSLEGTDDLIHSILLISFTTILLILIASIIINRILLKKLWKPFYDTLATVKDFKIDNKQSLHFPVTKIDEFDFMNQTLKKTTSRAQQDYLVLREFTENASHEMQTPLSIIRSKLDLLIQGENLSEEQSKTVQTTYQAIEKLSRLNYSLLLLAKIDNNQYAETSSVDLKQKIEEKIDAFNELWQNQNISVSASLAPASVHMNNELADILLNNLLSNATRYNMPGGVIKIELTNKSLAVSNNSLQKELDPLRIYSRFYKQEGDHGQNGLGLSIIKQICDVSGFKIDYLFKDGQHLFTISWP